MKPLEHLHGSTELASDDKAQTAEALLAQRLWQLVSPLSHTADNIQSDPLTVTAAASGSASLDRSAREHEERARDASGQLASAAYVLASALQQLGLARYATAADSGREQPSATPAFNLHIGMVDESGGTASLEIAHPQLGDISLEVELSQGSVRVIASAPTELSARTIEAGQAILAERLLRQGVVLERLEVVVRARRAGSRTRRPRSEQR